VNVPAYPLAWPEPFEETRLGLSRLVDEAVAKIRRGPPR
jgi:hypothetical protein